jgi:hypothetical protein
MSFSHGRMQGSRGAELNSPVPLYAETAAQKTHKVENAGSEYSVHFTFWMYCFLSLKEPRSKEKQRRGPSATMVNNAAVAAAMLVALPCCAAFTFTQSVKMMRPAGVRGAMSLRTGLRLLPHGGRSAGRSGRRPVLVAALSEEKDFKDKKAADEREVEDLKEQGVQELKGLAELNKQEQEELRKKLEEVLLLLCSLPAASLCFSAQCCTRLASAPLNTLRLILSDMWRLLAFCRRSLWP